MTDIVVTLMLSLTLGNSSALISHQTGALPTQPARGLNTTSSFYFAGAAVGLQGCGAAHLVTTRDRLIREFAADKTNPAKETCHQN